MTDLLTEFADHHSWVKLRIPLLGSVRVVLQLVEVELHVGSATVAVRVRDDGVGFDPEASEPGYGLPAMRARVGQIGGTLSLATGPGRGTAIRAEVPR